jgi:DNA-binding CsgD family transcriptional regulator
MYRFCSDITSAGHEPVRPARSAEARTVPNGDPAVLLLDRDRRIGMASPSAHMLLDDGAVLVSIAGSLSAKDADDTRELGAAFREVLGGRDSLRTIRLGRGEHEVELQLVALRGDGRPIQIIATIRALADDRRVKLAGVAERFGLTPAETRLLKILCGGGSLVEASAALGVARTTARTHLQRIFDKSGAHRQADLVRMVFAA